MTSRASRRDSGRRAMAAAFMVIAGWSLHPAADTYPRQAGVDARHYAIRLTLLTGDSNEVTAEAAVTLRIVTPSTREAVLDLTSAGADGKGMMVTSVTQDGRAVAYVHRDDRLHLPLPSGLAPG